MLHHCSSCPLIQSLQIYSTIMSLCTLLICLFICSPSKNTYSISRMYLLIYLISFMLRQRNESSTPLPPPHSWATSVKKEWRDQTKVKASQIGQFPELSRNKDFLVLKFLPKIHQIVAPLHLLLHFYSRLFAWQPQYSYIQVLLLFLKWMLLIVALEQFSLRDMVLQVNVLSG